MATIRLRNWEYASSDLLKAFSVLLKFYKGVETGDMAASFDWSYSLFESSDESFNQLKDGLKEGVISKAELRQFLKPSESLELAEENIKKITEKNKEENYA